MIFSVPIANNDDDDGDDDDNDDDDDDDDLSLCLDMISFEKIDRYQLMSILYL